MEGDEPKSPSEPEANEDFAGIAEKNVVVFAQYVYEATEAVEGESYEKKRSYITSHLRDISNLHNSLADQYAELIDQVRNNDLLEKISYLEAERASLKQWVQSLTVKNKELNHEVEENTTDIKLYKTETKMEIRLLNEQLKASKGFAKTIDGHMSKILEEKVSEQLKHAGEIIEVDEKMKACMTDMWKMKREHEKKEMIWNGVTDHLKNQVKVKSEGFEELSRNVDDLIKDKSDQNQLIHQLRTELTEIKLGNVWGDNVEKIAGEVKVKMAKMVEEVRAYKEAMSNKE